MKGNVFDLAPVSMAVCAAIILVLAGAALRSVPAGVDDLNLMRVFSMDEPRAVEQMLVNLEARDLDPRGFYNYGFLYQEIGYSLIRGLESVGFTADVRLIAISMRLVSLVAYLALLSLAYLCVRTLDHEGGARAALGAAFLASVPEVYRWAQLIHPDTLSAALVLGALVVAFSAHTAPRAILASGIAGLAFGVKYTGGFVLPFCLVPYYLARFRRRSASISHPSDPPRRWAPWIAILVLPLAAMCFATFWLATNPYVLSDPSAFYADLRYEMHHTSTGHGKLDSENPLLWWPVWQEQLGTVGIALTTLGLAMLIGGLVVTYRNARTAGGFVRRAQTRNRITVIGYVAIATLFLLLQVHLREGRYLLHILPAFVVAAFSGLEAIPRRWKTALLLAATAIVAGRAVGALQIASDLAAQSSHPYVQAGHFLSEHFAAETRILADEYSYLPEMFARQSRVLGVDLAAVRYASPDVIVINQTASGRWCWKEPGTTFAEGRLRSGTYINTERVCALERWLVSESSPFRVAYERESVAIFTRAPAQ